ncbi:penicillin acylase family protein [Roseinatronobacter bogoriensis]|uniref:Penicillin acylase family protein n=1 Tax=Roseinatronobacter bogoriensis subsp. barguzinensis TaxID=441209 RepID=A0A2K8KAL8_9RHOB|nr:MULTISPECIES: penicillin acylase family protein [Rhodobaca]ATX66026.1 penicillin acylase family protein [Rhodobaca barguzinensis]MBB4207975.1 penicillin amidase [Rhodobaca bogoriensis DSM 18756]TDW38614.1 penicillin amidase [Rhodobaca barguzinensis]TDY69347.1 penicillin amidase [Rhodobaca bogoriensis DSM 18756]
MFTLFRWLLRIFGTLAVLSVLVGISVYFFLSRSLPDYSESFTLSGVQGQIEIVRNTHNVPHIFAEHETDVFFGLGFAHAQDRLWQMQMLRRTAQGRLSEMFGRRTLRTDELMRRLDLYGLARSSVAAQDSQTQAALQSYADGVNAWLRQSNDRARGRGAPEFFMFNAEMPLWQPADSLAILKLLSVQLNGQIAQEVLRARASLLVPNERLQDLMPDAPGSGVAALPDYAAMFPDVTPDYQLATHHDPLSPIRTPTMAGASNSFAATPERAASDGAILANDPHLELTAPSLMYLARLELDSGGVIGASIPGIPAILSGRSEALGWGITSSYMDDSDIFIEELNPDNTTQYRTPDGWADFETRGTIIRIKDEDPVTLTLRWSENGPVLSGGLFDLGAVTPPGHVASLGWTALEAEDTTMTAAMRLMRAQSIEDALAAGELFVAPSQNLMLATPDRVAMQTIGRMPRRSAEHETQGRMPAPGWRRENRWIGTLPYSANPRFLDPESGILGNTNNKILDRPFPLHVSHDWGDTQRIERFLHLMRTRNVHTRDSFIEAQLDTVSPAARLLLPLVAADLWFSGEAAPAGTRAHLRQRALRLMADWNGEMNEHLPEPLIYAAWMRELQTRLIRDELGPLAERFTHVDPVFIERVFRDTDGAGEWCNIVQSSVRETCTEIAITALDEALLRLTERYGDNVESWRWGDAHMATHTHSVLGEVPLLRHFVNIRQSTSGGDHTLMRGRTSGRDPEPFANVHGAVYRGVYDFADPESSVFILSTGQSGHPLSRHYDDLGDLWRRGEYIPMTLDPELARGGAVGITTIRPLAE